MVTCLTRDSYLTHCFLQHLMLVLSSLERTPSPEPVDKDFYSEFGDKNTGTLTTARTLIASVSAFPSSLPSWPGLYLGLFRSRNSIPSSRYMSPLWAFSSEHPSYLSFGPRVACDCCCI